MKERTIFMEALERATPGERAAYLDAACAGDRGLRERVEALLRSHDDAGQFLGTPVPERLAGSMPEDTRTGPAAVDPDGPTADVGPADLPTGAVIGGRYKLIEQIGEGGMGTVWMAQQAEPVRRNVALKLIKRGMDSKQVLARFEAERQALALMDHPNIAKVHDAGVAADGRPYFVMELVKGVPITKYCDDHHLTPRQRLELFVPVCQAVQHAHQKGVIHRDLKPSNVLVALYDDRPVPKVIDFGVAKAAGQPLTDKTLVTGIGSIVGTLEYMSPEQAGINQLDIDTRSDIYSLGVLLYELLTGSPPLTKKGLEAAGMLEMLRVIREQEPSRPSTKLSTADGLPTLAANRGTEPAKLTRMVRGELDWIVMKALEKDRGRRYETANGFAMDVQRYLADEPVQACPPSATYRFRKFARRNKVALTMAGLISAAIVTAVVVLAVSNARITEEKNQKEIALKHARTSEEIANIQKGIAQENAATANTQRGIALENEKVAKANELLAGRRLYNAQVNLAQLASDQGQSARVLELLEGQRPKPDQEDLRRFEWYYLWRLGHRAYRRTLHSGSGGVFSLAYSPDGKTLAVGNGDNNWNGDVTVQLWHVAAGEWGALRARVSTVWQVAYSPDGKTLATAGNDKTVRLWDVATGRERTVFTGHMHDVRGVAFSPDGKTLASGGNDRTVKLWDLATGQLRTYDQGDGLRSLAFSPDGKTLASADLGRGTVKLWDWDGATLRERAKLTNGGEPGMAFSPDGKTLATSGTQLKLWDVATGAERASLPGHTGLIHAVAFAPDGKTLASGGNDRVIKLWDVATRRSRTLGVHRAPVFSLAFAPDGKTLASGSEDGTITMWDVAGSPPPEVLVHQGAVNYLAFSPTGDTLLAGGMFPTTIWDPATGAQRASLPMQADPSAIHWKTTLMAVSPDGGTLAYVKGTTVKVWDLAGGHERGTLQSPSEFLSALAFSPDCKTLASVGSWPITVQLWDLATLGVKTTFKGYTASVVTSMAFAPNGQTLAAGLQFGRVLLWDGATGKEKAALQGFEGVVNKATVAFSRDGKTLATGDNRGLVRLWDVATERQIASLRGHTDDVRSLAFFPDGQTLATGSDDGTVKLWDVATGQEKVTLLGHKSGVTAVAISADGKILASGSADGVVRLRRAATHPEALARQAEDDPTDPDSPRALKEAGDRLWSNGQNEEGEKAYRQAIARLEKRLTTAPNSSERRRALAVAYDALRAMLAATGRSPEADQARQRGQAVMEPLAADLPEMTLYRTESSQSQRRLGDLLLGAGRYPEAEAAYSRAIELNPQDSIAWFDRALAFARAGEYEKAVADYSKVIELRPDDARAWNNLGLCRERLNEPDNALECFSKAIAFNPDDALARGNRGRVHALRRRWNEAMADLDKAIELDPRSAEHRYQRGQVHLSVGRWDLAAANFGAAIDRAAGYSDAWLAYQGRASANAQAGRFAAATADYEKVLELLKRAPASAEAHNNLAWLLATCADPKFRDTAKAVELAKKAVELAPKQGTHWNTLGVAQYRAGDLTAAVGALNKSMELGKGGNSFDWFFLAMAHWRLGDRGEARKWFDRSLAWMKKSDPKNEELGRFLAEATNYLADAPEPLAGALRLRIDVGNTLRNAGDFNAALAQYSAAISRDPKFVDAWAGRADCYLNLGGALAKSGQRLEAAAAYRDAAAGYEKLIADPALATATDALTNTGKRAWWRHELGFACICQADFLQQLGQLPEADAVLCHGVEVHEKLVADYPAAANYKGRLAWTLHRLGNVRKARDQRPAAEKAYREAVALLEKAGLNDRSLGGAYQSLAELYKEDGRIPEAVEAGQKAVDGWEKLAAVTKSNDRDTRQNLGNACDLLGELLKQANRTGEAEATYRKSLAVWDGLVRQHPDSKDYRSHLRSTYHAVIDLPLSRGEHSDDWKAAITALEKSVESSHAGDANDWFFLALARWHLGNKTEARNWYDRAVAWMGKNDPKNDELLRFRAEAEKVLELKK